MTRVLAVALALLVAWAAAAAFAPRAEGCAFARAPTTYEAPQNRGPYLAGLELAGHNMLFPQDPFFGTPNVETGTRDSRSVSETPYIPPTLLKAIGWIESALAQGASSTPWASVGPALISFDCGHGIMQVTSGMTNPEDEGWPSRRQTLIATSYLYNIGRGAAILADKWNAAPQYRPIAGTDTDSDPAIIENWYFALWGYNGFTGPGANRSNHPMDPIYTWPRVGFSCGRLDDGYGHSYSNYPYQEIVLGCMERPPSVGGFPVWAGIDASLPNLSDPAWSGPLDLSNWSACSSSFDCAAMDIPSPSPQHTDNTARPAEGAAGYLIGAPALTVSRPAVSDRVNEVIISNAGSNILAWRAQPGQPWIALDKQGGVAISPALECSNDCDRDATLTITVSNAEASSGWVDIESLINGQVVRVAVLTRRFDVNCDGGTNALDALVVLQYITGLVPELACPAPADANNNGTIDAVDSLLILQFDAGLYIPPPEPEPTPTEPPPTEPPPTEPPTP